MRPEKLAMMANQIGSFFTAQGKESAPAAIAEHLRKFWDPVMRSEFVELSRKPDCGLDPAVLAAVPLLLKS